jgi:hypothetical protein
MVFLFLSIHYGVRRIMPNDRCSKTSLRAAMGSPNGPVLDWGDYANVYFAWTRNRSSSVQHASR